MLLPPAPQKALGAQRERAGGGRALPAATMAQRRPQDHRGFFHCPRKQAPLSPRPPSHIAPSLKWRIHFLLLLPFPLFPYLIYGLTIKSNHLMHFRFFSVMVLAVSRFIFLRILTALIVTLFKASNHLSTVKKSPRRATRPPLPLVPIAIFPPQLISSNNTWLEKIKSVGARFCAPRVGNIDHPVSQSRYIVRVQQPMKTSDGDDDDDNDDFRAGRREGGRGEHETVAHALRQTRSELTLN